MAINILEETAKRRAEFVDYCSTIMSDRSLLWVKNLFSSINKRIFVEDDDDFKVKAYPLYKNILKFCQGFMDDATEGAILQTLFICGVELGIIPCDDAITNTNEFNNGGINTDWSNISYVALLELDFFEENIIVRRAFYNDTEGDENNLAVAGLRTLSMLDYFEV